jgi:hypothetical protein
MRDKDTSRWSDLLDNGHRVTVTGRRVGNFYDDGSMTATGVVGDFHDAKVITLQQDDGSHVRFWATADRALAGSAPNESAPTERPIEAGTDRVTDIIEAAISDSGHHPDRVLRARSDDPRRAPPPRPAAATDRGTSSVQPSTIKVPSAKITIIPASGPLRNSGRLRPLPTVIHTPQTDAEHSPEIAGSLQISQLIASRDLAASAGAARLTTRLPVAVPERGGGTDRAASAGIVVFCDSLRPSEFYAREYEVSASAGPRFRFTCHLPLECCLLCAGSAGHEPPGTR